jgi:hypothetical protein
MATSLAPYHAPATWNGSFLNDASWFNEAVARSDLAFWGGFAAVCVLAGLILVGIFILTAHSANK